MSLRSEFRELGIKRNRGHSSLNRQSGDGDPEEASFLESPERDTTRDEQRRYAAYLMDNGDGVIEPLVGRLKVHETIKRASICKTERSAQRLIAEWQETYVS